MIWQWWGWMVVVGVVIGSVGAWSVNAARVFMKTLAVPLVLLFTRLALPNIYPAKNAPPYILIDFLIIAVVGFVTDYFVGLKLGRHDRAGYRSDSVGH